MKTASASDVYLQIPDGTNAKDLESRLNTIITLERVAFSSHSLNSLLDHFDLTPSERTHIAMSAVLTQCKVEQIERAEFTEENKAAWQPSK